MARRAIIWSHDPPSVVSGNFRFQLQVTYMDSDTNEALNDPNGLIVDVSPSLLPTARAQVRNAVKNQADEDHDWTLANDDVYFMDWSRELL